MAAGVGCLLLVVTVAGIFHQAISEERIPGVEAVIHTGYSAPEGQWPGMVAILLKGGVWCGGSLIEPHLVLTAKHCMDDGTVSEYKVRVADYDQRTTKYNESPIDVSRIRVHYDSDVDVAILELACMVNKNGAVNTVTLSQTLPEAGSPITVMGYGRNQYNNQMSPDLQHVTIPLINRENCDLTVESHEFCGGYSHGPYTNICGGDSGSPVMYYSDGKYVQVGITVRGPKKCSEGHHAIFVNTTAPTVQNFIRQSRVKKTLKRQCAYHHRKVEDKPEKAEDGKSCFPADALVQVDSCSTKRMDQVSAGDSLLSRNAEGELIYSKVMMLLHANPHKREEYLIIKTPSQTIKISSRHLILVQGTGNAAPGYRFAESVKIGDFVFARSGNASVALKAEVKDIGRGYFQGVYAPLTMEGTVVVDDVVASCYAYLESQDLAHLSFSPARFLHTWLPGSLGWWEGQSEMDIHWYPSMIRALTGPALSLVNIHV